MRKVKKNGELLHTVTYKGYSGLVFKGQSNICAGLFDKMEVGHLKTIRRSTYIDVGGCKTAYSGIQDWELALNIATKHGVFHHVNQFLYRYRAHENTVTHSDKASQLRKLNLMRRHYCQLWLSNTIDGIEKPRNIKYFSKASLPIKLDVLKVYCKNGYRCILEIDGSLNIGQIGFIRSFNSYFDQIKWNDPMVPAALIGYLWDPQIITDIM